MFELNIKKEMVRSRCFSFCVNHCKLLHTPRFKPFKISIFILNIINVKNDID